MSDSLAQRITDALVDYCENHNDYGCDKLLAELAAAIATLDIRLAMLEAERSDCDD